MIDKQEYHWDFNHDNSEILIMRNDKTVMRIGMCEVIDSSKPEFIMNHIYNNILPCKWVIGKWREYFDKKLINKFEG